MQVYQFVILGFFLILAAGCASASQQPIPDGISHNTTGIVELSLVKGSWFINHGALSHVEEGTYEFSGNQIKFNLAKQSPQDICDAAEKSFAYEWSFAGESISLKKLDDRCDVRTSDLAGGPFTLKGSDQ